MFLRVFSRRASGHAHHTHPHHKDTSWSKAVLCRFLELLPGTSSDASQYLRQFSSVEKTQFAVIKVGGAVVAEELEELGDALAFLQKVGLFPIVVHGGGPQLNKRLEALGEEPQYVKGLRVTSDKTLATALEVFYEENAKLVEHLENQGTPSRPILTGVFEATPLDPKVYGFVGEVTKIHTDPIIKAIKANQLPILVSVGHTKTGQALNINADVAASSLSKAIRPMKTVYLNSTGGLLDGAGKVISSISLDDYPRLMAEPWMKHGTRLKLIEIKELLDDLPNNSSVAITKAVDLPKELFTHGGAGTIIRKGETFQVYKTLADAEKVVSREQITSLLEGSFGKNLAKDYFESIKGRLHSLYISSSNNACAILLKEKETDVPYMCKFVVSSKARGMGLGEQMFNRIKRDNPKLFWRARVSNSINRWYFARSDGSFSDAEWTVFFYGIREFTEALPLINHALHIPISMINSHQNENSTDEAGKH